MKIGLVLSLTCKLQWSELMREESFFEKIVAWNEVFPKPSAVEKVGGREPVKITGALLCCICFCLTRKYHYPPIVTNWPFQTQRNSYVISGFRREADEICALVGYYAASGGNSLPTFRDNLSVHLQGSRILFFFFPMPPHVIVDFVVFPPGHGRSVTDFWGWDAHKARLRPDDVSGDIGGCSARRALRPNFY